MGLIKINKKKESGDGFEERCLKHHSVNKGMR